MQSYDYQLTVPEEFEQQSLRDYLANFLLIPKHLIFSLRTNYRVLVNGKYLPMNFSIHHGDLIQLQFLDCDFKNPHPNVIADDSKPIDVLYEDADLLIINKPRGVKTHANQPGESGALLNLAAGYLQPQVPYIIHRLDQETSGVLIMAKSPAVVPPLTNLIRRKKIKRTYLVWVHGHLKDDSGIITTPIGYDENDQRKRKINGFKSKSAITHYQVLKTTSSETCLAIQLETGRTHQIRVHLASLGHPIVNDPLYDETANEALPMNLHSWKVKLHTPFYQQSLALEAPIPIEMQK
ncbi:RluA family pseudouridine synthase [Fructilactobacillus vespulae]|uniref:RluA family pseudouridine synthase n=1 Tax=Fructilactobacillus vespulae TaxID=1249630 RepID=UPI0039B4E4C6